MRRTRRNKLMCVIFLAQAHITISQLLPNSPGCWVDGEDDVKAVTGGEAGSAGGTINRGVAPDGGSTM